MLDKKRQYREGIYADRLDQFKKAAFLQGKLLPDAVGGMMVKHTTQLFTMISLLNKEDIPAAKWKETIYDSINYHLLLLAALSETEGE
jgi:hypothetical protein